MTCDCIEDMNKRLAEHNNRLAVTLQFRPEAERTVGYAYPTIQCEILEKKRGQRPMVVLPKFCPWCCTEYHSDNHPADGDDQ